ncbi:unnamed protein product [Mytilus edulis]|uniref:Nephrocystin 3-like N-terminal domain-containing protein n=1 Tax=Mytilus edulis TaxID=6550 RepID=A0A8S3TFC8_MYTED|nr:unnamed protein product [Mytilus edulis]
MNQINNEHFDNFKSVAVALKLTVDGLQDFVHGNLQSLHQNIYRKCSMGQCKINCSRRYGNEFSRWCTTCSTWKKELHQFNRYRNHWDKIKWTKLDTIDFPFSYEEVAKVFVQDFTHVRQGVLKDLSAIMSIFRNLKIFNYIINDTLIADIQRLRNIYFAHNYDVSLHDVEKAQCFNCFIVLLKIQDIECTQSSKAALNLMEEMKTSQKIPERILRDPDVQYTISIIHNVVQRKTFERIHDNAIMLDNEQLHTKRLTALKKQPNYLTHFLPLIFLLATLAFGLYTIWYGLLSEDTLPVKGCLSVRFDEYWKSDLDFDSYVQEINNKSIIERSWILHEIQTHNDPERKGILMSANMGFGKSTIVSNIVCADPTSIWYSLRKQTLVYHICRHDSILSTKPAVFVRNLAGAIVKTNPEIGNAILSDDMALDFLYEKCSIDPVACLEFSVLNKIKQRSDDGKHLIIIDAIDECETSGGLDLAGLLYKKISFFPANFQFLITSRNIERLLYKFKELDYIDLQAYEQNNLQDIRLYLENITQMTNEEIIKLTEISGRNFLQVKHYFDYCKDLNIDDCDHIPESLEKIYILNFDRVFGEKGYLFEEFISMFEVLCSLQDHIDENKLFEVAGLKSKEIKRKASRIIGNELRHFIKISNGFISFQHKSISEFLTNTSRKHLNFFVDSRNGHKLFAKYLLNGLNVSKIVNLVEIVHHAAMAREPEYENILLRELKSENIILNFTYLNLVARDINCYETLKLFIKLIIPNDFHIDYQKFAINQISIKNALSEAAFIAAQYGNKKSMLALLDHGSDIMFTHHNSSNPPLFIMDDRDKMMCQYELFCGYSMLHIAAQRGYTKIVKELLLRNITLLYEHNTMKMNAFHLAAENGHAHVLRIFLKVNSSLGDSRSLYLASKNGHTKVVALLLNYVEDNCLPCTVNMSGRPSIQTGEEQEDGKLLVQFLFNMSETPVLKFAEDLRLLTCDTSLNAAVKNGHIEIVKILIEKSAKTVNCSIYDGSIPIFTAVKYNRNEIFRLLHDVSDLSHKCNGIYIDQSKLRVSETQILNSQKCPDNAGVEHLLAIYDNLNLIEYVIQKGRRNWESVDTEVVARFDHNILHTDKDENNFLHYASQSGNNWVFALICALDMFEDKLHLLLNQRNKHNRTPLEVAFDTLPRRKSFEAIRVPDNCSLTDVFLVKCKANYSVLLSPHEYFIFTVFQYFYQKKNVSEIKISELLEISINKSRIYPILIMKVYAEREVQYILEKSSKIPILLSKSNSPHIIELLLHTENAIYCNGRKSALHEIVHNDRNIQWTFLSFSFLNPLFKKYTAKFLDECFDDRGFNLLHRSIIGAHMNTMVYLINQGMNLWQSSKDNKTSLELSIYNSPYTDNGIIPIYYTRGSRFHDIEYVSSNENQGVRFDSSRLISFDETATVILDNMIKTNEGKRQLIRNQLCDSYKKDIGLIHIAAAKGLLWFLKTAKGIFGLDYLRCEDKFGVTPMYIAQIYNQENIVNWLRKLRLHMKRPNQRSENVLLFNMIDNYKSQDEYDWTCLLRYRLKYTAMIRNQILKCSFKNTHLPIHNSWTFKNDTFNRFRAFIPMIDSAMILNLMKTKVDNFHLRYKTKLDVLPSGLKNEMHNLRSITSGMHSCFKTYQNKALYIMRKFMLFGADDKDFYYLYLLSTKKLKVNGVKKSVNDSNLFYDVHGKHFRHFSKLKMRSELHQLWMKQMFTSDFDTFFKYKFECFRKLHDFLSISKKCMNILLKGG